MKTLRTLFFLTGILWILGFEGKGQIKTYGIQSYLQTKESGIVQEYLQFLSIPNETNDTVHILENAAFLQKMMEHRGLTPEILTIPGANPVIYTEYKVKGAQKTLIFYAHYDGQPVNPKQWSKGLKPFEPVFISAPIEQGGEIISYQPGEKINPEWRLSGRGSADDKAGIFCILNAWDAIRKTPKKIQYNLKFFFEGEEERGSTHLDEFLKKYKEKLISDVWIMVDGPRHPSGRKAVSFGVRGDVNLNLTVYGPIRPLHSGNYGNWAPNPGLMMAKVLAGMKDENGKVLIPGFYDDMIPISDLEKSAISKIPPIEDHLKDELAIAQSEFRDKSLMDCLLLPSLNINGMASGNTGPLAANVIPTRSDATLDLRLVPGNEVNRQCDKVISYIQSLGYFVTRKEPTLEERKKNQKVIKITISEGGYNAQRTSMNLPIAQKVIHAIQTTVDYPLVLLPSSGGSLPIYLFERNLGANLISIPVVNYDNNQHAENENVKIGYLWEGMDTLASIMEMSEKK